MKTRSSSGVGAKVDLEFDVDTLRITDLDEDEDSNSSSTISSAGNSVLNSLKRTNTTPDADADPSSGSTVGKVKAEVGTSQLRSFINNLGGE